MGRKKKVAAVVEQKPVYGFSLRTDSDTQVTREPHDDDSWDRGNTSTSWHVEGVDFTSDEGARYGDHFVVPKFDLVFPLLASKEFHILYGIYSTGDSFGHDDGKYLEIIDVYHDLADAEAAERQLREHYSLAREGRWGGYGPGATKKTRPKNFNDYTCTITGGDGKPFGCHIPWTGYFESLDDLTIYTFTIED